MLEWLIRASWIVLALIHATPAAAVFAPRLLERLYGIAPEGDLGVLMTHRAALFLAILALCLYAVVAPGARRAASLAAAISVVGFLIVYARAGMPRGPLVGIAIGDLVALPPLALVSWAAWRTA